MSQAFTPPAQTKAEFVEDTTRFPAGGVNWRLRDPRTLEAINESFTAISEYMLTAAGFSKFPIYQQHASAWDLGAKYVCTDADGTGRDAVCRTLGFKNMDNPLNLDCCVSAAVSWGEGIKIIPVGIYGEGRSPFLLKVREYPPELIAQVEPEHRGVFEDPLGFMTPSLKVPDTWVLRK